MIRWLKTLLHMDCDIDHDYYLELERTHKRKISTLEDIIRLKEMTIKEMKRHEENQITKFNDLYDKRTP